MGLFDILKKKPPTHHEKLNAAYNCYKQENVHLLFPGGRAHASNIVISLAKILGINLETSNAIVYHDLLEIYTTAWVRTAITQSSDDHILTSLQVKNPKYIKDSATAKKALALTKLSMKDPEFVLDDESLFMLNLVVDMIDQGQQTAKENEGMEERFVDDPEYGLVPQKPIYTAGVNGSDRYLSELRTVLGDQLTWERRGSLEVDGVNGIVDIYDSTLPSGRAYKTLYLNMYSSSNPTKAPKGFIKS